MQDAIGRLADPDVAVRERATQQLWLAGRSAEPSLRRACASDDPEVARRARGVLGRFALGLYPDTPSQVLDLVQQYRTGNAGERQNAVRALADQGTSGLRVLLGLRNAERDPRMRQLMLSAMGEGPRRRQSAALLLAWGQRADAAAILREGSATGAAGARDWAAMCLALGDLDREIAVARAQAKASSDDGPATLLAYLARAKGDLPLAALAADEADDPQLLDAVLIEGRDWRRLAIRFRERVEGNSQTLGLTAAFCRLAGQRDGFENALGAIKRFADRHDDQYWNCASALMLNDQVDAGLAVLLSHNNYAGAMDVLLEQMRFKEAIALLDKAQAELKSADFQRLRARAIGAWWFIGDRAAAERALHEIASDNQTMHDLPTWLALADAARQLGQPDNAARFLAEAMEQAEAGADGRSDAAGDEPDASATLVLSHAALPDDFPADAWWQLLRMQHPGETCSKTLRRLASLSGGSLQPPELAALADAAAQSAPHLPQTERQSALAAIAQTLTLLHRPELAEQRLARCVEECPAPWSLQLLGDAQAARGDLKSAADSYFQAWDIDRTRAVPLALHAWALQKTGDGTHARPLIELAHALPLADESQRTALEEAFRRCGLNDDAARERRMIVRTGPFLCWEVCNAHRLNALDASARGEDSAAADAYEMAFLRNLQTSASPASAWSFMMIPALIHKARALGELSKDPPAALAAAQAALRDSPRDIDMLIELTRRFEQAPDPAAANALFDAGIAPLANLCRSFPDSGPAHNQLAWAEARCHRRLDDALTHARRAVELEPANTANLDTLAEVYFARGQVREAIAQMDKCLWLEPENAQHQRRIDTFRQALAAERR